MFMKHHPNFSTWAISASRKVLSYFPVLTMSRYLISLLSLAYSFSANSANSAKTSFWRGISDKVATAISKIAAFIANLSDFQMKNESQKLDF